MELRHLRYFLAVADAGSIRVAANLIHVSAPSLSVQIQQLEAELGVTLFERTRRRMVITEAGRGFAEHCRATLAQLQNGIAQTRALSAGQAGLLNIGYVPAAIFNGMLQIVPAFRVQWPNVELSFQNLSSVEMLEALRRDELDIAFVGSAPSAEFDVHLLTNESLVVAVPQGHRLASRKRVTISDLGDEPLVQVPRDLSPQYRGEIERRFAAAGVVFRIAMEFESPIAMLGAVAVGIGCSILTSYTRRFHLDGVVYLPLHEPDLLWPLLMVKKKERRGLVEQFYRFSIEQLAAQPFRFPGPAA